MRYLYEYEHNGSRWGFTIDADDQEDARARLKKLAHAKYLGDNVVIIPAAPGVGWLVKLWCVVANFFRNKQT